ncbi:MAG: helix-turn-helix domain-containing protein [Lachnospiraceae bacterium]|nr:helix-turn-helix domain-containing protein [Lachnospiraceae bacterium]
MVSTQILQNTLDGLKNIAHVDMCITDLEGRKLATTSDQLMAEKDKMAAFLASDDDSQIIGKTQYFKISDDHRVENVLIVDGKSNDVATIGKLAAYQLKGLLATYRDRYDQDGFIKNLLLDNLLLVDIYNRAKKLGIDTSAHRCVFIAETSTDNDINVPDVIQTLFPNKEKDFITAIDENDTILVKEIDASAKTNQLEEIAKNLSKALHEAGVENVSIAYGTIVNEIKEVSRTYKEAKMALDVGKIFYEDREIVGYAKLGIGRLIYQLPLPLCKMFIREIFDGRNPDEFDEETVATINKFFENSLNVSETSRQLYIHRNTLVYRIDKLQRTTGLDLRIFDDAITFKIALMVGKYMKYMENQDY